MDFRLVILAAVIVAVLVLAARVSRTTSTRRRWRRRGPLLDRVDDTEDFLRFASKPIPLVTGGYRLPRLFSHPHEKVEGLQRRVASLLLGLVGSNYLPRRFVALLKDRDAYQTTRIFLSCLDLEYGLLLRSSKARRLLVDLLRVLADADVLRQETGLSELPLYDVLRTHDKKAIEERFEHFRFVAGVVKTFESETIDFPSYYEDFFEEAKNLTRSWEQLGSDELAEIYEHFGIWKSLHREYRRITDAIDELITFIHGEAPPGSPLRKALSALIREVEGKRRETEDGRIEPALGIETLNRLLEKLQRIAEKLRSETKGRARAERPRDRTESNIRRALETLGLHYPEDLKLDILKKRYRKLVIRHHPDRGGDVKKFRQTVEVYDLLRDHLETIGAS